MKITNAQILLILAALGLSLNPAMAERDSVAVPENVRLQIEALIAAGLITFETGTNKPVVNLDVLKNLESEGRVGVSEVGHGTICGGVGRSK